MNEIEVKAKLRDKEKVLEHLKKLGAEILSTKYQKDIAYWPNDVKTIEDGHLLGKNYMRIREQESNGKKRVIFTLKQTMTNQLDCIEHEIDIKEEDIFALKNIILTLGFYEFITIEKNRTTAKLDDIEVCLDDVTDLGSFIELEKFGESENADKIQGELNEILASWGINQDDYLYEGYDILLHKKKNNL